MKRIYEYLRKRKLLVLLFFLFILVRLPFLAQLNLLHDERDIVLSGWSIAKTGKDLFGNSFPLVFQNISPNNPLFAIYFAALWFLIVPIKSVFLARLPFLLVSSLIVFLSFEIVKKITNDEKKSLLTTILLSFNPWIFHITRLALDIPLALVFLLAGILLYLNQKKFIAYFFFILTAFTYQGSRLLIPFLVLYLETFFLLKHKNWRVFLLNNGLNIIFIILLGFSAYLLEPNISKDRLSEIIFFDTKKNAATIDFRRITTIAPLQISRLFDNKFTFAIDEIFVNFTRGIDISYLFKTGDYSALNGNASTGQFFFVFIIFYFLGIASLAKNGSLYDLYIVGLIPLGMIPTLLSTRGLTFSIRGVLSSLGYSYLISLGILYFQQLLVKKKIKKYILSSLIILLAINVLYFIYGYYFRRPVTVGELFYENERQLSDYLSKNDKPFTIYHLSPKDLFLSYIFLKNGNLNLSQIQNNLNNKDYSFGKVKFILCNQNIKYLSLHNAVVHQDCLDKKTYDLLDDINNRRVIGRIPYKDFSQKYAYFVIE